MMTANDFTSTFSSWLGIIGTAIPPVGGTLVGHFFFVDRDYKKTFENMPDYRIEAFIAWIVGIVISRTITFGIKPLNGFLAAVIFYAIARMITKKNNKTE